MTPKEKMLEQPVQTKTPREQMLKPGETDTRTPKEQMLKSGKTTAQPDDPKAAE